MTFNQVRIKKYRVSKIAEKRNRVVLGFDQ